MENCKEEMLMMTVYADTVTDYTEEMRNDLFPNENMMEVEFPRSIVEAWYEENSASIFSENNGFEDWLHWTYTADDTDGLFQFSIDHGYHPVVPKPRKREVQLTSTYTVWSFDDDGAVETATKQHEAYSDYWIYVDGKCYS